MWYPVIFYIIVVIPAIGILSYALFVLYNREEHVISVLVFKALLDEGLWGALNEVHTHTALVINK